MLGEYCELVGHNRFSTQLTLRTTIMVDPIAYFLTWPTYGTWLPGDARGWIEHRKGWKLPDPILVLEAQAKMRESACVLSLQARTIVESQVAETCQFRKWTLHTVSCRSNHMHVVITAGNVVPRKIRSDLKGWCSRRLRENIDANRENWWAERGSIRWVFDETNLASILTYVSSAQDRKQLDCERA